MEDIIYNLQMKALALFEGNSVAANNWLVTKNRALGDRTPLEAAKSGDAKLVENLIGRIENGIFS